MKERWDPADGGWIAEDDEAVSGQAAPAVAVGDTPEEASGRATTLAAAARANEDDGVEAPANGIPPEAEDHQALRRAAVFALATGGVGLGLEHVLAAPAGASLAEPVGEMLAGGSVLYHGPYEGAFGFGSRYAREMEEGAANGGTGVAALLGRVAHGPHVPDADENQRDLDALMWQHHLDLDLAVQQSDLANVHTQIDAHGRTLSVDTSFEARSPDNEYERHEAYDHVLNAEYAGRNDVEDTRPGMRFRSQIAAHLDAQNDEGISM